MSDIVQDAAVETTMASKLRAAIKEGGNWEEIMAGLSIEEINDGTEDDDENPDGQTALMVAANGDYKGYACDEDKNAIVKALIQKSANVDAQDNNGRTPLLYAARDGFSECVRTLMESKADPSLFKTNDKSPPLINACWDGHAETVEILLELRANPNQKKGMGHALTVAAQVRQDAQTSLRITRALLQARADPNMRREPTGDTPLHFEECLEVHDMLDELLAAGADPSLQAQGDNSVFPLYMAKDETAVEKLLSCKAQVDMLHNDGRSAIHKAAEEGSLELCEALCNAKANPNLATNFGKTPLLFALEKAKEMEEKHAEQIADLEAAEEAGQEEAKKAVDETKKAKDDAQAKVKALIAARACLNEREFNSPLVKAMVDESPHHNHVHQAPSPEMSCTVASNLNDLRADAEAEMERCCIEELNDVDLFEDIKFCHDDSALYQDSVDHDGYELSVDKWERMLSPQMMYGTKRPLKVT